MGHFTGEEIELAGTLTWEEPLCEEKMRDWLPRIMRNLSDHPLSTGEFTYWGTGGGYGGVDVHDVPLGFTEHAHSALDGLFLGCRLNGVARTGVTVTCQLLYTTDNHATEQAFTAAILLNALNIALTIGAVAAIPANAKVFARLSIGPGIVVSGKVDLPVE